MRGTGGHGRHPHRRRRHLRPLRPDPLRHHAPPLRKLRVRRSTPPSGDHQAGDATIAVDDLHAARGTHALHIKTVAGGGSNFAYIKETKTFPATNNVLYGRMFVWFEDALTTDGHFSLAEGAGTGTAGVIRFGGQFKAFGVGTDGGSSGDWTDSDRTKLVPTQTWICAEFQFDGPTHTFHVWWDDMERPMLTSGPSKHASFTMPTFNGLWFGWWMYNLAEPQEIWIDEIAVDYKPIGLREVSSPDRPEDEERRRILEAGTSSQAMTKGNSRFSRSACAKLGPADRRPIPAEKAKVLERSALEV